MSSLDRNVEALEHQLQTLQVQRAPGHPKKIPPPPPPKKNRAQPQVPYGIVSGSRPHQHAHSITSPGNHMFNEVPPPPPPPPHLYSNLPSPPPPPQLAYYCDDNGNTDHMVCPPSPVSSNYSELARAMNPAYPSAGPPYPLYQNHGYGSWTSPYESIYEPVELNSSISQPDSYATQKNIVHEQSPSRNYQNYRVQAERPYSAGDHHLDREKEVDALTQLLVQSIGEGAEPNTYGICVKCRGKVQGDDPACTAMNQIFHVECFTCARCDVNLQGEVFYVVDGQPHCEQDYLETLERCSVCDKPIRDRILRATGKPYHPACFVCIACGKSLDGIPFTVDAANQIHCIEDFHAKFAPRCCVCELPIMPEEGQEETVRVVALDRSFHVKCYRCEDCGLLLSSEEEGRGCYPLDDHILCKTCNGHRIRRLTNVITTDL